MIGLMDFLKRWFRPSHEPAPRRNIGALSPETSTQRVRVKEIGSRFFSIPEVGFFGQGASSPNGRYRLFWRDGNDEGTVGGHREVGEGLVLLLDGDRLAARVRAERPHDGKVADYGRFIVNDWCFGEGLKGRFLAWSPEGKPLVEHVTAANLLNNGLSDDGRLAMCQTANAPGEDGSRLLLFDLDEGRPIASFVPEQGWAESYAFDPEGRWVELGYRDGSAVRYDRNGAMLDREAWVKRRVSHGVEA